MNTLNNLPYMPTELWDKIFDIKFSLEDKEEHKIKQNMVLEHFNKLKDSLLIYYPVEDWFCRGESINSIMVKQRACKIDISVFSRSMIRSIEEESWDVYDPLAITDDEHDDDYFLE